MAVSENNIRICIYSTLKFPWWKRRWQPWHGCNNPRQRSQNDNSEDNRKEVQKSNHWLIDCCLIIIRLMLFKICKCKEELIALYEKKLILEEECFSTIRYLWKFGIFSCGLLLSLLQTTDRVAGDNRLYSVLVPNIFGIDK
jgi:hypothetical protein